MWRAGGGRTDRRAFGWKSEGNRPLGYLTVVGRIILRQILKQTGREPGYIWPKVGNVGGLFWTLGCIAGMGGRAEDSWPYERLWASQEGPCRAVNSQTVLLQVAHSCTGPVGPSALGIHLLAGSAAPKFEEREVFKSPPISTHRRSNLHSEVPTAQ